jgi:3-dehydroquinate dehydratase-2
MAQTIFVLNGPNFNACGKREDMLADWLHETGNMTEGAAINSGAHDQTSISPHDASRANSIPVVKVFISSMHAREEFRHTSMIAPAAKGITCGFGPYGHIIAPQAPTSITQ